MTAVDILQASLELKHSGVSFDWVVEDWAGDLQISFLFPERGRVSLRGQAAQFVKQDLIRLMDTSGLDEWDCFPICLLKIAFPDHPLLKASTSE